MAKVTIEFGADSVQKNYNHTRDILNDSQLSGLLSFQKDRVSLFVRGVEYEGPLSEGDVVTITTKQNTKG